MKYLVPILASISLSLSIDAAAGEANLSWMGPTQNTDGSPLTDLAGFKVFAGCQSPGTYELGSRTVPPTETSYRWTGLPDWGVCYFAVLAFNDAAAESPLSNEDDKDFGPPPLPGIIQDLQVTYIDLSVQVCTDCIDFADTESYEGDAESGIESVNDGVRIFDNTWRATIETFDIGPDTVLEFDFESSAQGEIHGIGFDTNLVYQNGRHFALWGTQTAGGFNNSFKNYAGGAQHYVIPVGQFYTGQAMRLVIVNDHDNGSGSESIFRNVRVH